MLTGIAIHSLVTIIGSFNCLTSSFSLLYQSLIFSAHFFTKATTISFPFFTVSIIACAVGCNTFHVTPFVSISFPPHFLAFLPICFIAILAHFFNPTPIIPAPVVISPNSQILLPVL